MFFIIFIDNILMIKLTHLITIYAYTVCIILHLKASNNKILILNQ